MLVKATSALSDNPEIYQQRVELSAVMAIGEQKRDSFESQADIKSISI